MYSIIRKYLLMITLPMTICLGFSGVAKESDDQFLSLDKVEKRFGSKKFEAEAFKMGDMTQRASMASDLIRSKKYIGKSRAVILKELGEPNGYYRSETFIAYLIYVKKSDPPEALQILFVPDSSGNIVEVKVQNQYVAE